MAIPRRRETGGSLVRPVAPVKHRNRTAVRRSRGRGCGPGSTNPRSIDCVFLPTGRIPTGAFYPCRVVGLTVHPVWEPSFGCVPPPGTRSRSCTLATVETIQAPIPGPMRPAGFALCLSLTGWLSDSMSIHSPTRCSSAHDRRNRPSRRVLSRLGSLKDFAPVWQETDFYIPGSPGLLVEKPPSRLIRALRP